ncbi:MAG: hypothetical protein ACK4TA_00280 [Saprospiraceae bacterium]
MKNEINVMPDVIKPGFEVIINNENGFYYFQCNDVNGKVVLWSKDFPTQSSAVNKMEQALRLARNAKNYLRKNEGEDYYFTLIGGNKQEVAKSAIFKNEKELQRTIDYVQQVANAAKELTIKSLSPKAEPEIVPLIPTPTALPEKSLNTKKQPGQVPSQSRYAFKIDLYPREAENLVSGRIEYLLTEEFTTFQGIDTEAISLFLKQHLPMYAAHQPEEIAVQEQATLVMQSHPGGQIIHAQRAGQTPLYFVLRDLAKMLDKNDRIHAKIRVRSLDNATIAAYLDSKLSVINEAEALMTLPGIYFSPGIYRLQATCTILPVSGNTRMIEANCLFQIY